MNRQDILHVQKSEEGLRLDKLLAHRFEERFSRSYFQQILEMGHVLLNGFPAKKRVKVSEGDEVEVLFVALAPSDITPEDIPLDILFEDEEILAVNKPAGMVVHPAPGNYTGTFVNALLHYCTVESGEETLRPGIVHRLDKETSGVLIAGKTLFSQSSLIQQFADRSVEKVYIAVCGGVPKSGSISAAIGRHPKERVKMALVEGGKPAETTVSILGKKENRTLVQAVPKTGRTHQIRLHLLALGAPIFGDKLYGSLASKASRHLLHAQKLTFTHPTTKNRLTIEAPIPEDMRTYYENLSAARH